MTDKLYTVHVEQTIFTDLEVKARNSWAARGAAIREFLDMPDETLLHTYDWTEVEATIVSEEEL